jgi:hypothetical protein
MKLIEHLTWSFAGDILHVSYNIFALYIMLDRRHQDVMKTNQYRITITWKNNIVIR